MLRQKDFWIILFWATIAVTLAAYWPGLRGGFLFDDEPNLSPMASYGGIENWETFKSFILNGSAGPLGRPLSLASFLLNDNYWPSSPSGFKLTNLWLHLLTGLVLCWATLNLLRFYEVSENQARWAAVFNMAFWVLHPYMVSTTLYVVQRMAQLTALFILAGLAGYLHGRTLLQRRPIASYFWMTASLILGTSLAVLSKENGILLPLLALITEWCRPKTDHTKSSYLREPDWRWRLIFLWLPSLAIFFALGKEINFSPNAWPTRNFNQVERLLTEPRILWEYLFHLYVPRIEGEGLFQDGYVISKSLLSPSSTLPSLIGILALVPTAAVLRKRLPYLSLAILFFLASHLIESTVVGLELYFEHRNYAASAFLFLPIIMALLWIAENKSRFVASSTLCAMLCLLATMTWQRATLWSDTGALQQYWSANALNSPRAQSQIAIRMSQAGRIEESINFLEAASRRLPESSLLSMQWLLQKILQNQAKPSDFEYVKKILPQQRFDAQSVLGMRLIIESLIEPGASTANTILALELLDVMRELPQFINVPVFYRLEPHWRGLLQLTLKSPKEATVSFLIAMERFRNTEFALSMVSHLGNAGYPHEALQLLEATREIYRTQPDITLQRSRAIYNMEIERLNNLLMQDIAALRSAEGHTP